MQTKNMYQNAGPFDYKLTRKNRLTIMITLITSFFVIAPILVLYTAGYRYNTKEHRLEGTGVISIDAEPTDATVTINSIKINKKLPIWLPNRAPGVYALIIEKQGYKTWSDNISVSGNQTSFVKNISLLKDSNPSLINLNSKTEQVHTPNGNGALTILQKGKNTYDLVHYNQATSIITPIVSYQSDTAPELSISPYKNMGASVMKYKDKTDITLFSFKEPYNDATYSYKNIINYAWSWSRNNPTLFIQSNGVIEKIETDLSKKTVGKATSSAWYVDADNNIWNISGNTIANNMKSGVNKYDFDRQIHEIIDINKSRIVLRYDKGLLIVRLKEQKITEQTDIAGVEKINFHPNTGEWWAWSNWELWSVYQDGSSFLLNRSSEKIINALPMDNYGVILIVSGNSLYSFNPGYYTNQKISACDAIGSIDVNRELKKIFFLGVCQGNEGLFEIEY